MKEFHGLIGPIFTPVDEKGNLDRASFEKLAVNLSERGVDGLYVTGTTGEASQLRTSTWAEVNKVAIDLFKDSTKTKVYSGAVFPGTKETIDRIHQLEDMGAETVFATPTFYNTDGTQDQVLRHFEAICESTPLKVVIYSIGFTTHVNIESKTLGQLAQLDNIIGIKDTRADWGTHLENIRVLRDTKVGIACVPETMIAASLLMGSDAIVTALGNFMPEYYVDILKAAQRKDVPAVMEAFEHIMAFDMALRCPGGNGLAKLKYLGSLLGIVPPYTSMSTMAVTDSQKEAMRKAADFITAERERLGRKN